MKTLSIPCLALAISALLCAGPADAQKSAAEAQRPNRPEDAARIRALLARQAEHDILGQLAGAWEGTLQARSRGTPPREMPSPATMEIRWMLDNYFLESDETFQPGGQITIHSRSVYGYNPHKKYFHRTLFQAGDPREYLATGTWNAETRTLTFKGPEHNAVTGDEFQRRDTFRLIGEDQIAYELSYVFQDGSELQAVQGIYRRKR
ncbi:MAG TPA: DUF1579 family protein [Thermoanaerobaculia bacterium]|jgi:hypothetical protein|nr:DUF1579 family protein [Thermoanaerobaculia bacterium]